MRPRTPDRTTQVFCLLSLVAALSAESATLFSDGFETYSNGTQLISGINGWGASDAAAVVQDVAAFEGAQAALIPPGSFASNGVAAGSNVTNLWVEVLARRVVVPVPVAGPPAIDTNAAVMAYLDTNSNLVVYDPDPAVTNWVTITTDFWNTNLTAFCTGQWARLSLDQNYQTKKAAIFLEGHLIREQWSFINTNLSASGVRRFRMDSGGCLTSFVDNVTLSLEVPVGLTNMDLDQDGVADASEIQANGNVDTIRRLWLTMATTNLTDGGPGGGWLSQPATNRITIPWTLAATNLQWSASNGFYAVEVLTNGVNAGSFGGINGAYANYAYSNSTVDATVTVAFARMPVISASNSLYGSTMPASTNVYPGASCRFDFSATNGHYFIAGVLTNGQPLGTDAFSGWGTDTGWFVWSNIVANGGIEVQYAPKYTASLSVTNTGGPGVAGCTISASPGEVFPGGAVTFTLSADTGYTVAALKTNGVEAALFAGGVLSTNITVSNIRTNLAVTGVFAYIGRVLTVPGDYSTIQAALAGAFRGDTIVVNNGTSGGGQVLGDGVTLVATNSSLTGSLTVSSGATGTLMSCSGLVMSNTVVNGQLVISNGIVNAGTLTVAAGGLVQVVNGQLTANGTTLFGTFTLDSTWGGTSLTPSRLNFANDFESHAEGIPLQTLGASGWATPDATVAVQAGVGVTNNQGASTRAAVLPAVTELTNVLDTNQTASLTNIWTDCFIRGTDFMPPDWALHVDAAATAIMFFNTSTQMVVRNNGQWDICSNDVAGASASSVYTGGWARVTLNQNYTRKDVAVFLNGRLMRQHVPFVNTNQVKASAFLFNSGRAAPAYLDNVNILTNVPPDLISPSYDSDHDGIPDAVEIDRYGDLSAMPRGSVFRIR